ncbi:hypothetical protein [Labrenzia sp. CE80]|uniref:hypothetical protein n=1 Tax=Labrenzia sp. CE80 TaxID=1788986 RepID=UPI00129B82D6|nr:hypothetical protein [Labrenzia sp. CE80]
MLLFLILTVTLYGVIALFFLIFSAAELIDSGKSSNLRLLSAVVASAVWPVTLIVMTVVVLGAQCAARLNFSTELHKIRHVPTQEPNVIAMRRVDQ